MKVPLSIEKVKAGVAECELAQFVSGEINEGRFLHLKY